MSLNELITGFLGRWLGLERVQTIAGYEATFGAGWAREAPAWLVFGCLGLIAIAVLFYVRYQRNRHRGARGVLLTLRAAALCLLLVLLAEPILTINIVSQKRPLLWLLFDGTDSMAIPDELASAERAGLAEAVGMKDEPLAASQNQPLAASQGEGTKPPSPQPSPEGRGGAAQHSRMDYVKALVQKADDNLLEKLSEKYRLQAFLFDSYQGVRSLELSPGSKPGIDQAHLAEQLTTDGQVTAIGAALDDLRRRHASPSLGGLVIFSDFGQNADGGLPPVEAAKRLGVEVYSVGVGATAATDVAVELFAPLHAKKDERTGIEVTLLQQGLYGQSVHVTLSARELRGLEGDAGPAIQIAERDVVLSGAATQKIEFPYEPHKAGRFLLAAEVAPVPGETIRENNRAEREIAVMDDIMRLLYVEYEPTWEWRFIKEVFHRDRLVGREGFRTFLHSSDARVRETNELFLKSMTPTREKFFAHDVIFLGDMPATALSQRFCDMTEEFVKKFGGGLVVLAGPRFGPEQLADTPLAKMLPVVVEHGTQIDDRQPFRMKLTAEAALEDFMRIGDEQPLAASQGAAAPRRSPTDPRSWDKQQQAWENLGPLPWFQPVVRASEFGTVLAEHPTRTGADGKKQPLIALRRYGKGQVVYLGFNETWRLRRKWGEKYYRQFWGQMIYRLALNHALGSHKRFVVSTDRRQYHPNDPVMLTVEAFTNDFKELTEADVPNRKLEGELIVPGRGPGETQNTQRLSIAQVRPGVFETKLSVAASGEYRVRVIDPIAKEPVQWTFKVIGAPIERQRAVRNAELQQAMAHETGGKSYDLRDVQSLPDDIRLTAKTEATLEVIHLANTWLSFALVVGLLVCEWLIRKYVNLA